MQKEILMKNKSNQTMRAVAIDEFGGIEKMKPRELPVPEVATDEILVRVDTAGVGVWDTSPLSSSTGFGWRGNCGRGGRWGAQSQTRRPRLRYQLPES